MLQVTWIKNVQNDWLPLDVVELGGVDTFGVYAIWHAGRPGRVVRIGQGDIASRVGAHARDPAITAYAARGRLYVTWAEVSYRNADGVERYLAEQYPPLVGSRWPDALPIRVNHPWAA